MGKTGFLQLVTMKYWIKMCAASVFSNCVSLKFGAPCFDGN